MLINDKMTRDKASKFAAISQCSHKVFGKMTLIKYAEEKPEES